MWKSNSVLGPATSGAAAVVVVGVGAVVTGTRDVVVAADSGTAAVVVGGSVVGTDVASATGGEVSPGAMAV